MFSVHRTHDINRLATSAKVLLDLIQSGELLSDDTASKSRSTEAADRLEQALEPVLKAATSTVSPFIQYRMEILGTYDTAAALRRLVMHLWNHSNPVSIGGIFWNADEHHTRIALELICAYTRNGERDQHFMALADEIRDNFQQEEAA